MYKDAAAVDVHKATPHFKVWSDFKESGGVVSLKIDELVSKRVSPFVFLTHGNCCHFVD